MPNVTGFQSVVKSLAKLEKKYGREMKPSVTVGFTQDYAIYVHENLEAAHPVGEAKYLEKPARRLSKTLGSLVQNAVRNGATIEQALLIAGLRLQREAQELTPVDTGALKASAFTCKTSDVDRISRIAYQKGQRIRKSELQTRRKAASKKKMNKFIDGMKKTFTKQTKKMSVSDRAKARKSLGKAIKHVRKNWNKPK